MAAFMREAAPVPAPDSAGYQSLWQWSIDEPEAFWAAVWKFAGVIGAPGARVLERGRQGMRSAKWFPQARLNFVENLLRADGSDDALVFWGEDRVKRRLSRQELRLEVARFAAALRAMGVQAGDRVAAWLPNMPETIVAMLAAASIGAVFTSASPDFGVRGRSTASARSRPRC
jgi:acetoacetyl-CoA synthetase